MFRFLKNFCITYYLFKVLTSGGEGVLGCCAVSEPTRKITVQTILNFKEIESLQQTKRMNSVRLNSWKHQSFTP